jgi:hypothetical protein
LDILAKPRQVGPASWPVVDRPGGLSYWHCGTKPIRRRWRFPKRSQFAKVSAVRAMAWGVDQRSQFQGNPGGGRGANGMRVFAKRSQFRIPLGCENKGERAWWTKNDGPPRFQKFRVSNDPTWLQGSRRLEQGIPGKRLILREKESEIEANHLANYRLAPEKMRSR